MKSVILIGGGGHAKAIIDIIKVRREYHIAGIIDNNLNGREGYISGVPIIGSDSTLHTLHKEIKHAIITLGATCDTRPRIRLYKMLKQIGFELINAIHPSALIADSLKMGVGNAFMAGSIINVNTKLGSNCIINTGSIVEHDCIIEDHVHIATGAKLAGGVKIREGTHIGIGTTIKQGITIGKGVVVGAGAVVLENIPDNVVCVGIPAKIIKQRKNYNSQELKDLASFS